MFEQDKYTSVVRSETCTLAAVRRVASMLDLDPDDIVEGDALPKGWHFILLGADTRRSELRADGFPGLGVPMPELGLPRLLLGGRAVEYHHPIPIGATVERTSTVKDLVHKSNASGPMVVVTIEHRLRVDEAFAPAIVETQTYVLLPAQGGARTAEATACRVTAEHMKEIVPDETLLFQYSALGFNSHKIHIDKSYARDVEGFPDLVVNGGLTTLLLMEFARRDIGINARAIRMKNTSPLFCGHAITLTAEHDGDWWRLRAHDDTGKIAAEMEVNIK
ncbi:MaoC family dehydratase N-terminal domain-containing protein [Massilia sp. LXY-6]|uniref:FAS1-like dehydratase domain-containing protein n=1 Tax=Massilia sp. LXY-6 TaxID=3379823 RepID=UPI003EE2A280